jgi:hypothetical protein
MNMCLVSDNQSAATLKTGTARRWLLISAGATIGAVLPLIAAAPNAYASSGIADQACQAQYPANGNFDAGHAYLMAPGDASSWRCKQTSTLPGGGAISSLPVDIPGYCTHLGQQAVPSTPPDWACS